MTLLIGGMMVWMMIATATSSHPLVSIKFFISRTWFIVGFYLFLGHILLHKKSFRENFVMMLLFPLTIVITYTLIRHAGHDFSKHAGHWMMKPFFKDHTSYGAVLAMMFPTCGCSASKKGQTRNYKSSSGNFNLHSGCWNRFFIYESCLGKPCWYRGTFCCNETGIQV